MCLVDRWQRMWREVNLIKRKPNFFWQFFLGVFWQYFGILALVFWQMRQWNAFFILAAGRYRGWWKRVSVHLFLILISSCCLAHERFKVLMVFVCDFKIVYRAQINKKKRKENLNDNFPQLIDQIINNKITTLQHHTNIIKSNKNELENNIVQ